MIYAKFFQDSKELGLTPFTRKLLEEKKSRDKQSEFYGLGLPEFKKSKENGDE